MRVLILSTVIASLAAGGCATVGAKAKPEPASLDVPAPPPRVIIPPEPEPAAPEAPPKDPEPSQQKPARGRPSTPRPEARKDPAAAQKTEPPPPVVETVRPVPPANATLSQELPSNPLELQRKVKDQLTQAKADLYRVNYQTLNQDGRSQYDMAKRFIDQAEQALKEQNFVFAAKVAEKAAGLAASLSGRDDSDHS